MKEGRDEDQNGFEQYGLDAWGKKKQFTETWLDRELQRKRHLMGEYTINLVEEAGGGGTNYRPKNYLRKSHGARKLGTERKV